MKHLLLVVYLATVASGAKAATQYCDFTSAEGKTIRGRTVAYDAIKQIVSIEREDTKRTTKIPMSLLSQESQDQVKEWRLSKDFLSERKFQITADRRASKDDEESYRSLAATRNVEDVGYEVVFDNRSSMDSGEIKVEYCIYYMQELTSYRSKEGVYCGSFFIDSLPAREAKTMMTDTVAILSEKVNSEYYYTDGSEPQKNGKVHGLWLRAHMKLPSGKTLVREYGYPDSIGNKRTWATSSVCVGMNKTEEEK